MNWSACQFPRSDKWHVQGKGQQKALTQLLLDADVLHTSSFNCRFGPLDVLGTSVTVSCSPLPSRRLPGRVIRKRSYVQAAQQRCADENVSRNASVNAHRRVRGSRPGTGTVQGHVHVRTLLCICARICGRVSKRGQRGRVRKRMPTSLWTRLQAYTQRPWWTRMPPCVKLLRLWPPTPAMVRLDTNHLQTPADVDSISGRSENVCVHTSLICSGGH